jgi:hypothetical protein
MYNTWSHWVSGILNTRKTMFPVRGKLKKQLDSFSETLCFLVFRVPDDAPSPETQ